MKQEETYRISPVSENNPGAQNGPPLCSLEMQDGVLVLTATYRFRLGGCTAGPKSLRPCSAIASELELAGVGRVRLSAPLILPARGSSDWASVADPELRSAIVAACRAAEQSKGDGPAPRPAADPEAAAAAARALMGR